MPEVKDETYNTLMDFKKGFISDLLVENNIEVSNDFGYIIKT